MDPVGTQPRQPPVRSILYFLLTPLLGCHLYEPESLPKLLVCAGAIVLLNGWILWGAREKSLPWPKGWAPWLMLALGLITIGQSFRATNAYLALVEVTLNLGGIAIALALASSAPMRAFLVRCLPATTLVIAIVLAAVGIGQWNRFAPTACLWIGPWIPQVPSLFANANYAGTFVAMMFPLLLVGTLLAPSKPKLALWSGAACLLATYLMLSQSRAGAVAAVVTLAAAAAAVLYRRPAVDRLLLKLSLFCGSIVLGMFLSMISLTPEPAGGESWTSHALSTSSAVARVQIWNNSARMAIANPILGVGVGNFRPAYHDYRDPEELGLNTIQDPTNGFFAMGNPHNNALHLLTEMGPIGLISAVGVVVFSLAGFWRRSKTPDDLWLFGMAGVVMAFVLGGLFNSISNRAVHMAYVWVAIGYLLGSESVSIRGRALFGTLLGCGALVAFFAVAAVVHLGGMASRELDVRFIVGGKKDFASVDRAVDYHPWNFHQRLRYGNAFLDEGDLKRAEREFAAVYDWEPNNPYVLLKLGDTRLRGGHVDDAMVLYERSLKQAPLWALPKLGTARVAHARGDLKTAEEQLTSLLDANPAWPEALVSLGLVRGAQDRHAEAAALFEEASALKFSVRKMLASRPESWLNRPEYRNWR